MKRGPTEWVVIMIGAALLGGALYGAGQCAWVASGLEAYVDDASRGAIERLPQDVYVYAGNRAIRAIGMLAAIAALCGFALIAVGVFGRTRTDQT